jgi:hypothetical protein
MNDFGKLIRSIIFRDVSTNEITGYNLYASGTCTHWGRYLTYSMPENVCLIKTDMANLCAMMNEAQQHGYEVLAS